MLMKGEFILVALVFVVFLLDLETVLICLNPHGASKCCREDFVVLRSTDRSFNRR